MTIPITVPMDVLFWCILPSPDMEKMFRRIRKITPVSRELGNIRLKRRLCTEYLKGIGTKITAKYIVLEVSSS